MNTKWTNGKHPYHGKRNDRFKRMFSKLKMPKQDLTKIFEQIQNETTIREKQRQPVRESSY